MPIPHSEIYRAREGDELAFKSILRRMDYPIRALARCMVYRDGDMGDVLTIIMLGVWEAIQLWDGQHNFARFAISVAQRDAKDLLDRSHTRKAKFNRDAIPATSHLDEDADEDAVWDTKRGLRVAPVEEEVAFKQAWSEFSKFLEDGGLTDQERICLAYMRMGYSLDEVPGIAPKSVDNASQRARRKIRRWMAEYWGG